MYAQGRKLDENRAVFVFETLEGIIIEGQTLRFDVNLGEKVWKVQRLVFSLEAVKAIHEFLGEVITSLENKKEKTNIVICKDTKNKICNRITEEINSMFQDSTKIPKTWTKETEPIVSSVLNKVKEIIKHVEGEN